MEFVSVKLLVSKLSNLLQHFGLGQTFWKSSTLLQWKRPSRTASLCPLQAFIGRGRSKIDTEMRIKHVQNIEKVSQKPTEGP